MAQPRPDRRKHPCHHHRSTAGLGLGALFGWFSAVGLALSPLARAMFRPVLVLSQAVPVFALAPILTLWFGFERPDDYQYERAARFTDDHRHVHGVGSICRVLRVASSTYYVHKQIESSAHEDAVIVDRH